MPIDEDALAESYGGPLDRLGEYLARQKALAALKGIDGEENIFIVDYGDVRFYMHRMNPAGYTRDNAGKPTLSSQKASELKYNHERILNVLRGEDVLVPVAFWTVIQGHQNIITVIEDRYVNLLRALIDVHDIVEWEWALPVPGRTYRAGPRSVVVLFTRPGDGAGSSVQSGSAPAQ